MDLLSVAREYFQALGIQFFAVSHASPGFCQNSWTTGCASSCFPASITRNCWSRRGNS